MDTKRQIHWFELHLAIAGVFSENTSEIVKDLQDELGMRPHLRNPKVHWEPEINKVTVQVDIEGLTYNSASKQMAEELFEVACAVLSEIDGMSIEIMDDRNSR